MNQINQRIDGIVNSVIELFKDKATTYYETMDVLVMLQSKLNGQVASMLKGNAVKIKELSDLLIDRENDIMDLKSQLNLLGIDKPK